MVLLGSLLLGPQALSAQRVAIQDGRMSADLREASLVSVARDIENQAGISFKGDESLLEETVSVAFNDLPLEQGIKRILASLSYSLLYDGRGEVSAVVIMSEASAPPGAQPQIRRAPPRPGAPAPARQRPVIRRPGATPQFAPGQRRTPVPARPRATPRTIPQRPAQVPPASPQAPSESNLPEPFRGIESAPPGGGESEGPLHPAFRAMESQQPQAVMPVSPRAIPRPPSAEKSDTPAEEQASKEEASSSPRQD